MAGLPEAKNLTGGRRLDGALESVRSGIHSHGDDDPDQGSHHDTDDQRGGEPGYDPSAGLCIHRRSNLSAKVWVCNEGLSMGAS